MITLYTYPEESILRSNPQQHNLCNLYVGTNGRKSIQDKAVTCIHPGLNASEIYQRFGILRVVELTQFELCKLGYNLTHNMLPKPLSQAILTDHRDTCMLKLHHYNTRHKSVPNLPIVSNTRYRHSYLFKAVSLYSKLPKKITELKSVTGFTHKCKDYISNKLL